MYHHFIIIASSYLQGSRVAFHMSSPEGQLDADKIQELLIRLEKMKREDVGIHSFVTDSSDWNSVLALDSFFEDVAICRDFDEFEAVLKSDLQLSALDVAKFFLSMRPMSHLKLQKMIYLAYKTYLLEYGEPLFSEKILAYRYGPVVEEVYQKFKCYGSEIIETSEFDSTEFRLKKIRLPQTLGRIGLVQNVEQIVPVLQEVMERYGDLSARQLVTLTHSPGGPWDTVFEAYQNHEIGDDVILLKGDYETL